MKPRPSGLNPVGRSETELAARSISSRIRSLAPVPAMEGERASNVLPHLGETRLEILKLASNLQVIHGQELVQDWPVALQELADAENLDSRSCRESLYIGHSPMKTRTVLFE